jgi:branched-chain amino acid transport system permease protein
MSGAAAAYAVGLASDMAIMSMLALSAYLMLLVGRVSFGQQAFFGLGAYASGVMSVMFQAPLGLALAAGAAFGALCSWLLALPTLRLSGLHYAVATLAFGEMARIALGWWHWQRPGDDGPVGPAGIEGFRDIRWLLENDVSPAGYLGLTLLVLLCVLAVLMRAERLRLGVGLRMIGQDDTLAAAQGIAVNRLRRRAGGAGRWHVCASHHVHRAGGVRPDARRACGGLCPAGWPGHRAGPLARRDA